MRSGRAWWSARKAPDGVIEAIEDPQPPLLPGRPMASGISDLGRRRCPVRCLDRGVSPMTSVAVADTPERIAKRIARSGLCSRRDAERWIAAGRVAVDGDVLSSPALTVTAANLVTVDGEPLPEAGTQLASSATTSQPAWSPRRAIQAAGPTIYDRHARWPATPHADRPARSHLGRSVAADQRWRPEASARAADHRLAAALSRARPWSKSTRTSWRR